MFAPAEAVDFLGEDRLLRWTPVARRPAHRARHQRDEPVPAAARARPRPRAARPARCCRSAPSTTRSCAAAWTPSIYALYSGARFVVVGTPAGITLAPEGGAHQSTITPSIGLELPGVTYAEPAYARALDWLLCDGLADLARPDGGSLYLRLSTRPIDQAPFTAAAERLGAERLRADVLAGGYRLREPRRAGRRRAGGVRAGRCPRCWRPPPRSTTRACRRWCSTSRQPDRLYRGWRDDAASGRRAAHGSRADGHHLAALLDPGERHAADRDRARRRQPPPRLAGRGVRYAGRAGRRRRVRPVGQRSPSSTASSTSCRSRS